MIELTLNHLSSRQAEHLSDVLFEKGALSVILNDDTNQEPLLEPKPGETPLWQHCQLQAHFESIEAALLIKIWLQQSCSELSFNINAVEAKDWVAEVNALQKPLCFSDTFFIYPSTYLKTDLNKPHLILDPGLAFGTGTHPTTSLCLHWLVAHQNLFQDQAIIDYGCGSGILGLSALKLGANQVYGIDLDPQALLASKQNATKNNIQSAQCLWMTPETFSDLVENRELDRQPILIANILLEPLLERSKTFKQYLRKTQGHIVLSGILVEQVEALITHFSREGWQHIKTMQQDGWALVTLTTPP